MAWRGKWAVLKGQDGWPQHCCRQWCSRACPAQTRGWGPIRPADSKSEEWASAPQRCSWVVGDMQPRGGCRTQSSALLSRSSTKGDGAMLRRGQPGRHQEPGVWSQSSQWLVRKCHSSFLGGREFCVGKGLQCSRGGQARWEVVQQGASRIRAKTLHEQHAALCLQGPR